MPSKHTVMQVIRILFLALLGTALATGTTAQRATIEINTQLQVLHHGNSNYALWGSPAQYEAEAIRTLNDVLQSRGIERVNVDPDYRITVDRMTLRESAREKKVDDPDRPGVTARTWVAQISVHMRGTITDLRTGKTKRWRRTLNRSETVQFRDSAREGRPRRLEKKRLAPNVCAHLSRKTARKAAKRIARKVRRMER